ncbi:hypothetical protein HN011_003668 [Eciton burchellii]|nr:hypothetical protein HN011_003668 [Eciton burchellii]
MQFDCSSFVIGEHARTYVDFQDLMSSYNEAVHRVVYENYRPDVQSSDRLMRRITKARRVFRGEIQRIWRNWRSEALETYIKLRVRDLTNEMIN